VSTVFAHIAIVQWVCSVTVGALALSSSQITAGSLMAEPENTEHILSFLKGAYSKGPRVIERCNEAGLQKRKRDVINAVL